MPALGYGLGRRCGWNLFVSAQGPLQSLPLHAEPGLLISSLFRLVMPHNSRYLEPFAIDSDAGCPSNFHSPNQMCGGRLVRSLSGIALWNPKHRASLS